MYNINTSFDLLWLFEWSWNNSFTNILTLCSPTKDQYKLFTYSPFPSIQIIEVFKNEPELYSNRMDNFHEYPIKTSIGYDPPRVYKVKSNENDSVKLIGYEAVQIQQFFRHINATLKEIPMEGVPSNHVMINNFKTMIKKGLIDISIHGTIIPENDVVYAYPYDMKLIVLMIPYPKLIDYYKYFIIPFQNSLWLSIFFTLLYFSIIMTIIDKLSPKRISKDSNFGKYFLQGVCGIVYISNPYKNSWRQNLIYGQILLLGLVISNFYITLLSSFLTANVYEKQIKSIQDLITSKFPVMIHYELTKFIQENEFVPKEFQDLIYNVSLDVFVQHRDNFNNSYAYPVFTERIKLLKHQQMYLKKKIFTSISMNPLFSSPYSFILKDNSPYDEILANFIIRIRESGLYDKWYNQMDDECIEFGFMKFLNDSSDSSLSLNLNNLMLTWYVIGFGSAMATFIFILEIMRNKIMAYF